MTEYICNACGRIFEEDDDPLPNRNNRRKKRVICLRCRSRDVEVY